MGQCGAVSEARPHRVLGGVLFLLLRRHRAHLEFELLRAKLLVERKGVGVVDVVAVTAAAIASGGGGVKEGAAARRSRAMV